MCHGQEADDARFIPTRVGKSSVRWPGNAGRTVHPHACGEVPFSARIGPTLSGSSPRVWGSLSALYLAPFASRFIPTRVGKSRPKARLPAIWAVHPHACGEVLAVSRIKAQVGGSSPRVWGSLYLGGSPSFPNRFIPTRVGKSRLGLSSGRQCPVHPHACGEVDVYRHVNGSNNGSSPRVWGSPFQVKAKRPPGRFIPTRVGKSHTNPRVCMPSAVHPHACGEVMSSGGHLGQITGSSPRVWGSLTLEAAPKADIRFIPTRVGKSCALISWKKTEAVHPHACGEVSSWNPLKLFQIPEG